MLKIGITGGIGSGKSVVCRIFSILGIPVFEADKEAKNLINNNQVIRNKFIHLFGSEIYTPEGPLDRKKLAEILFKDQHLLNEVNGIVHPEVRRSFVEWADRYQNAPYIIHEAAILIETGFYKMMDRTILVVAPEPVRVKRVVERDHLTEKEVAERISRQWDDSEKMKYADYIITNDDKKLIIPQVIEIDKILKEYGKIW